MEYPEFIAKSSLCHSDLIDMGIYLRRVFYFEKEMAGASAMHIKAKLCKAGYHSSKLAIIPSLNSGQFEKH